MLFDINNSFSYSIDLTVLKKNLKRIAKKINLPRNSKVSIAFVDDKTIKQLNKSYRGINKITSILSFTEKDDKFFKKIPKENNFLGEIIICYPEVRRKASKNKNTVINELVFLLMHGLLHLAGYTHQSNKKAKAMEEIEKRVMEGLKI